MMSIIIMYSIIIVRFKSANIDAFNEMFAWNANIFIDVNHGNLRRTFCWCYEFVVSALFYHFED